MSGRRQHPNKHIESALKHAESEGWTIQPNMGGAAHPWANVKCPYNKKTCRNGIWCRFGVWGTPANPEDFAKKIYKAVDKCEEHRKKKVEQATQEVT